MAIVDVRQLRSFRFSENRSDKNTIQYGGSVDLLVVCDAKDPSFGDIKNDTNTWPNFFNRKIPQVGDSENVGGIELNVTSRDFQYYKDNDRSVVVSIKYDAKPVEQDPPNPEQPEFFKKWSFQAVQTTQPASESFDENGNDPKIPVNSAQDPVEGLTEEVALIRGTYTNSRVESPDFSALWRYMNFINSQPFLGAGKRTLRVTGIGADFDEKNQVWSVSVEMTYKSDEWSIRYYDVGYNEIVNGERRAILDKSGNPVSRPVALNADGSAKPVGQLPDKITIFPYAERDLSALFSEAGI